MRTSILMGSALALSFLVTGCATKKYVATTVAQSISPVETRVTGTEGKNAEQDKLIAGQGKEIEDLDSDLSRTKEKLTDVEAKAIAAGDAAKKADDKAAQAATAADGAARAAQDARTFADNGLTQLSHTVEGMNKFQMTKSETVLFGVNKSTLAEDEKAKLGEFAKSVNGIDRYVIEIQGFTDKTGPVTYNEALSQERAQEAARYLANEFKIPVRSIVLLGSGYAQPVGDDKTRDGRKQNRRVEVRLFVPEASSTTTVAQIGQQ